MIRLVHRSSGQVLLGWQVPPSGRMPDDAMIDWLHTSVSEWDGDECGITIHAKHLRTAVPGDIVAMAAGSLVLVVIHAFEFGHFEIAHVKNKERTMV